VPGSKPQQCEAAFRHGLSRPLPSDPATSAKVDWIADEVAGEQASEHQKAAAQGFARAQIELLRIRSIRSEQLAKLDLNDGTGGNMRELKRNIMAIGVCQNEPNFLAARSAGPLGEARRARWIEQPYCCRPDFSLNLHESENSLIKQNSQHERH
jgi:hypothetical protein